MDHFAGAEYLRSVMGIETVVLEVEKEDKS